MSKVFQKIIIVLLIIFQPIFSFSQNPTGVAYNFGPRPGFFGPSTLSHDISSYIYNTGYISSIVLQNDGKMLVCGDFGHYNGMNVDFLIRLNSNGTKDTSFNTGTGFNNIVNSIAIQSDGKILIGGKFTSYNGLTENRLIRLNSNGTKDTNFNIGTGFNGEVSSITVQSDGKILIGGVFEAFNGITENRLIRLNSNGTKDTSFNTGTDFNGDVNSIAIQSDGKILVGGGYFYDLNGTTENRLIRLNSNGTKDTSFNTGMDFNGDVNSIAIQSDGKILVGGEFTTYNGITENRLIRLNSNGTKDTSFNIGTGFNLEVSTIAMQSDGKILIGGFFEAFNGTTENRLIRLNSNGTKDTIFNILNQFHDQVNDVKLILIQSDGKILLGADFVHDNLSREYMLRLNSNGTKDTSFNTGTGFNNMVNSIVKQSDGKILVGGRFTTYNGTTENYLIRFNVNGTKDTNFNIGTGFNGEVSSITVQSDGKILIGGVFEAFNGITENRLIRLNSDGTKDTNFNIGTGFNGEVSTIAVQSDGKILVGGAYTSFNGTPCNLLVRLNINGTRDTSFVVEPLFYYKINYITLQNDGKIIVAANFVNANGVYVADLVRLNTNGTKDTSFIINIFAPVLCIKIQSDGKILVGGTFRSITRLNINGEIDTSFNSGLFNDFSFGEVSSIVLQTDGKILIGGNFGIYNSTTNTNSKSGLMRLNVNGTIDTSFNLVEGFSESGWVRTIALQEDGKILAGGFFHKYENSNDSAFLISLNGDSALSNTESTLLNQVTIFPNPASTLININFNNITELAGGSINIINSLGQQVVATSITATGTNTTMSLNRWGCSGLYFVQILNSQGQIVDIKKIILQ